MNPVDELDAERDAVVASPSSGRCALNITGLWSGPKVISLNARDQEGIN